jgi:hypothetical protein
MGNLQDGLEILVLGGQRGDILSDLGDYQSYQFSIEIKVRKQILS